MLNILNRKDFALMVGGLLDKSMSSKSIHLLLIWKNEKCSPVDQDFKRFSTFSLNDSNSRLLSLILSAKYQRTSQEVKHLYNGINSRYGRFVHHDQTWIAVGRKAEWISDRTKWQPAACCFLSSHLLSLRCTRARRTWAVRRCPPFAVPLARLPLPPGIAFIGIHVTGTPSCPAPGRTWPSPLNKNIALASRTGTFRLFRAHKTKMVGWTTAARFTWLVFYSGGYSQTSIYRR